MLYIIIKIQELLVPFDTMNWPWNAIFRHRVQKDWRIILGHIAMKCIYFNRKLEDYFTKNKSIQLIEQLC